MILGILMGGVAPDWLWLAFLGGVCILLALDVILLHRKAHEIKIKEAVFETLLWISVAIAFNVYVGFQFGTEKGFEFLAGYLIEKSLSLDNVFVILLIFTSLKIPDKYQHRVLFWGILGAIVFRAIFILAGAALMEKFHGILYVFGGILIISAYKFLFGKEEEMEPEKHWAMKILKKIIPVSKEIHGEHFFIKENHKRMATPLFAALIIVEISDVIFAVDSIPAVFAVTIDPFIAFTSNIMAILGLRALFFVIAHWMKNLRYLKPGLAVLLAFVGVKMLIVDLVKIPIWVSLTVIMGILLTASLGSWYANKLDHQKIHGKKKK